MKPKFAVGQVVKYEDRYVKVTHVFPLATKFMYATTEEVDLDDLEPYITVNEKSLVALSEKEKGYA